MDMANFTAEELTWLKGIIAEKMASQQQLGLKELNELPKTLIKKIDQIPLKATTLEHELIMPEFTHTSMFDSVVFMRRDSEVGRINVGKI